MTEHEIILRRAPAAPASWKPESRTFEATLATGAAVPRTDARGAFDEVLSLDQTWPESVPLLDGHQRDSVDNILGTVANIRTVAGELIGTATLSAHSPLAQRIAAELSDGARFGVSIGYKVRSWLETKTADGRRAKVATKLDLLEASLVPLAADGAAGIRGVSNMPEQTTATQPTEQDAARAAVQAKAQINAQIRSIGELAGLDRAWCDAQIDAGAEVEAARKAAFDLMTQRTARAGAIRTATASVGFSGDDPMWKRGLMSEALFSRAHPEHQLSEAARPYRQMTLLDMQRALEGGISTRGGGAMTTGDFTFLLQDVMNKELRQSYAAAPAGVKRAARFSTSRDFRLKHKIMVDGPVTLSPLDESGEFRSATVNDGESTYKLGTYGNVVKFSRQSIVNDNLGGLSDPARMLGRAGAETEARALATLLTSNPLTGDGFAVFSPQHHNIAATPAAISVASLSLARQAMRTQTGLSGEPISATPKYLIVGPEIETVAEQVLHTLSAVVVSEVNPFQQTLQLLVEPRIVGKGWYLAADTNEIDGLEYAHLADESGPQVLSELPFNFDGIAFRIRLDFGAGWIDRRGWQYNAGA
jgi:HK97 family phage prohead protease